MGALGGKVKGKKEVWSDKLVLDGGRSTKKCSNSKC